MSNFRGRLFGLSLFMLIALFFCGLSLHAVENCAHIYVAVESHDPTCASEGGTTYQCSECSHTYIGDIKEKLPHTWQTLSETKPTCTASGALIRKCTVCETEETTVNGDATGHHFSAEVVKKPTCSAEGYTYHTCNACGETEIIEGSATPTTEHTYEKKIITEPTCGQEGYAEFTCTVCEASYRESVPIVDHDLIAEVTAPTHTEGGYTTYTCRFCGLTSLDDLTDPAPYDMEYTVEEPTCTENGYRFGICRDNCQHTESEVLPATGHSFGEGEDAGWTLVRAASEALDGLEERICTTCGLSETRLIAYVAPEPEPEPAQKISTELIICFVFAFVLLLGVMVVVLLFILERAGHKNHRKYALLTAVDKAIAEEKEKQT